MKQLAILQRHFIIQIISTHPMRFISFFAIFTLFYVNVSAQYWQQKTDYEISVSLNDQNHQYKGTQKITYTNQSPDTLDRLYMHLYMNAFRPNSLMDIRSRNIADPDGRVKDRISKLTPEEQGYLRVKNFQVNGILQKTEEHETLLSIFLNQTIAPGQTVNITLEFEGQVPIQIRRNGRDNIEGIAYSMAQWYPKLCNYDAEGWHANPYIGREFYGIFGKFDVKINLPAEYLVGGTGVLQNPEEIGHGYSSKKVKHKKDSRITWHFVAEQVHDFAWAADKKYKHVFKPSTKAGVPDMHFFYNPKTANEQAWEELPTYMEEFFALANELVGTYAYPQFTFIQAGDGGMEYPMTTFVRGNGKTQGLVMLCVHEALHNWFYGMLGFNESKYHYMDEGFTTYIENIIRQEFFPSEDRIYQINPHFGSYSSYRNLYAAGNWEPMATHADHFVTNRNYGVASYSMGAMILSQLELIIGKNLVQESLKEFFETWKFKHPKIQDFIKIAERNSGLQLKWFIDQWVYSTKGLDYAIKEVSAIGEKQVKITLEKRGAATMPLELIAVVGERIVQVQIPTDLTIGSLASAKTLTANVWPHPQPEYELILEIPLSEIDIILLDPKYLTPDLEPGNNVWKRE